MKQPRQVYVLQIWQEEKRLILRLREQNQSEPKHFHSWAELLIFVQEQNKNSSLQEQVFKEGNHD